MLAKTEHDIVKVVEVPIWTYLVSDIIRCCEAFGVLALAISSQWLPDPG